MTKSIHVPLTKYEVIGAASAGMRRWTSSLGSPLHNEMDYKDGWAYNIEGAIGERVVAKFLNQYWSESVDTFQTSPDVGVGPGYEVKTRSEHWHDLIVRKHDVKDGKLDKVIVHVTGHSYRNDFQVRGWITAGEAMRDEWWKAVGSRPAAWFVPADALHTDWIALKAQVSELQFISTK